jgi:phage terminase small subunit
MQGFYLGTFMGKLSLRELTFANEYIVDKNATQAAIRAGYSEKTANEQGCQLLARLSIRGEVYRLLKEQFIRINLKSDAILSELYHLAKYNIGDAFTHEGKLKPIHEIPRDLLKAVQAIDFEDGKVTKLRFASKEKANELLGKHLKLFTELHSIVGNVTHHHKITLEEVTDEHKRRVASNFGIIQRHGTLGSGAGQN